MLFTVFSLYMAATLHPSERKLQGLGGPPLHSSPLRSWLQPSGCCWVPASPRSWCSCQRQGVGSQTMFFWFLKLVYMYIYIYTQVIYFCALTPKLLFFLLQRSGSPPQCMLLRSLWSGWAAGPARRFSQCGRPLEVHPTSWGGSQRKIWDLQTASKSEDMLFSSFSQADTVCWGHKETVLVKVTKGDTTTAPFSSANNPPYSSGLF